MEGAATREVVVRLRGRDGEGGVDGGGGVREYTVVVGEGVQGRLGANCRGLFPGAKRAFLVADEGLPSLTIDMARDALRSAGCRVELATLAATEEGKSLETVGRLVTHMAAARLERTEPVVALGGGIVGDVAAFAAAVYRRGAPVIQCPTTLLAMVDASVGGKCGVNVGVPGRGGEVSLKKNMVGAFHQPSLVVCDVSVLDSLGDDELASGMAECVKHALIGGDWGDPGLLEWTRENVGRGGRRERAALVELVARNVAIKAQVVAGDEREEREDGLGRMSLNMGHTVGHAIETMEVRGVWKGEVREKVGLKHGEAVALGLIAEAGIGEALGVTRPGTAAELSEVFDLIGLPTQVEGLPSAGGMREAMLDDKKVGGGKIRVALPTGKLRGGCEVVSGAPISAIEAGLYKITPA